MSLSQQPVVVYPNTATRAPSSHSNGSFGTVFIVLAVIVVVSAIACFLGRLCSKRVHHPKPKQNHASRPKESRSKESRPRERDPEFRFDSRPKERDIEFGFDNRMPTAKPAGNGEAKAYKPSENGEIYGENRPAHDGEFRATG
ncbi:hypothetical protein L1049_005665 [Liquidambar formosana]|uniref:Transmembrane protein n=1 Tax=Liquidambar formosana TaxID=63359 RepID=A0AAP0REM1_LIQFO